MKYKVINVITTIFLLINFVLNKNTELTKGDVSTELDNKLNDLFSYYKNLIQNTDSGDKKEVIKTLENKVNSLLNIESASSVAENLLIQNSQKINKKHNSPNSDSRIKANSLFLFEPFVWKEYYAKKSGPAERRGHSSTQVDTYLVIFGGCLMDTKCFNDLHFFDMNSNKWSKIAAKGNIPSPRQGHSAVMYGSTMWVYGGSSSDGFLSDLYSYELEKVK
jgi:hypothetical protein